FAYGGRPPADRGDGAVRRCQHPPADHRRDPFDAVVRNSDLAMTFANPLVLLAVLIVPLLLGGYLWQLRRQRRNAVRFSSVSLVRQAVPKRSRWRRHVPIGLFLAAIAALAVGAARPRITQDISINKTSIILTLDVSG